MLYFGTTVPLLTRVSSQLLAGQPLWAKLFYLVRTGHTQEALDEAVRSQAAIEHRESSFLTHFRAWVESTDGRCGNSVVPFFIPSKFFHSGYQEHTEINSTLCTTLTCCTHRQQILSSLRYIR